MKRLVLSLALLTIFSSANAAIWTNGTQLVDNVIWKPGYHGFYTTVATQHDPEGCGSGRMYLFDPTLDEKTVDRLYAMLLTAQVNNKTVYVWVDGCIGLYPKIVGLQINR